jgi:hypothetical protein
MRPHHPSSLTGSLGGFFRAFLDSFSSLSRAEWELILALFTPIENNIRLVTAIPFVCCIGTPVYLHLSFFRGVGYRYVVRRTGLTLAHVGFPPFRQIDMTYTHGSSTSFELFPLVAPCRFSPVRRFSFSSIGMPAYI